VSLQNLFPEAPQRVLILLVTATATAAAIAVDLVQYQSFLFLLGSFFVPLFGVLAADFLLCAAPAVPVRWGGVVAWLAGFTLYQWIQPTGPGSWVSFASAHVAAGTVAVGASLPSFAVAFALYAGFRSAFAPRPAPAGR